MCPPENFLEFYLTTSCCLSSRPRKIQRLLGFNSAIGKYFKSATDGLDRRKSKIQPFLPITNHCKYEWFPLTQCLKFFYTYQYRFTLLSSHFLWDEIPCHSYLFSQLGDSNKGRWFLRNVEPENAVNATLRHLSGIEFFFAFHVQRFEKSFNLHERRNSYFEASLGDWIFLCLPCAAFRKVIQPPRTP